MKQFAPGFRGGSYSESDDLNMQIEIINGQAFLDRWAGGGWKNISVHKTYDDALRARSEIAAKIRERGGEGMSREEIIRMARDAGMAGLDSGGLLENFECFAALVAAAEREAICQLADDMLRGVDALPLIEAILARGEK